jgi:hypothetical protein
MKSQTVKKQNGNVFGSKAHLYCAMRYLKWTPCCPERVEAVANTVSASATSKGSPVISPKIESEQLEHKDSQPEQATGTVSAVYTPNIESKQTKHEGSELDSANSDLFIWAILMGRTELAKIFWSKCVSNDKEHCISRALFAAAVARRLADSSWADSRARKLLVGTSDSSDSPGRARRVALAVEFEDLAIRLMQLCYEKDQAAAVQAVALQWTGPTAWMDVSGPEMQ